MQKLFPRVETPKVPKPVFTQTQAPAAFSPTPASPLASNAGSADSNMGKLGATSLIRSTQRKPDITGAKRTLLGG